MQESQAINKMQNVQDVIHTIHGNILDFLVYLAN